MDVYLLDVDARGPRIGGLRAVTPELSRCTSSFVVTSTRIRNPRRIRPSTTFSRYDSPWPFSPSRLLPGARRCLRGRRAATLIHGQRDIPVREEEPERGIPPLQRSGPDRRRSGSHTTIATPKRALAKGRSFPVRRSRVPEEVGERPRHRPMSPLPSRCSGSLGTMMSFRVARNLGPARGR